MRAAQSAKPQAFKTGDGWFAYNLAVNLVPFPLEYALYRIPVSPARHSRLRGNPELEVTFQYRQDHLETVLAQM